MGYLRDVGPWVGRVSEALMDSLYDDVEVDGVDSGGGGLWISAGYTGQGMPVAGRCSLAVAEMILRAVEVPRDWLATAERAELEMWSCSEQSRDGCHDSGFLTGSRAPPCP